MLEALLYIGLLCLSLSIGEEIDVSSREGCVRQQVNGTIPGAMGRQACSLGLRNKRGADPGTPPVNPLEEHSPEFPP